MMQETLKFDKNPIGASVLEAITSGLYTNNLNCIREYVQNALDAGALKIEINYINKGSSIEIRDDGRGMDKSQLINALTVGYSSKGEGDIGWRGLGMWSGAAVCDALHIVTKAENSPRLSIDIDCNGITKANRTDNAEEAIRNSLSDLTSDDDDSPPFTKITLAGIYGPLRETFSKEKLIQFLKETVPMKFSTDFIPGNEILESLEKYGIPRPKTSILVEGEELFKNPANSNPILDHPAIVPIKSEDLILAVAWFLNTGTNKKIKNGSITFRKSNFRVGDTSLVFANSNVDNKGWQIGEIHVLNKNIVENASRDSFEASSSELNKLYAALTPILEGLQDLAHYSSESYLDKTINGPKNPFSIYVYDESTVKKPKRKVCSELLTLTEQVDERAKNQREYLKERYQKKDPTPAVTKSIPTGGGPQPTKMFETLKWDSLIKENADENALIAMIAELYELSKSEKYKKFPIATGTLLRSVYEQCINLIFKLNGQNSSQEKLKHKEDKLSKWLDSKKIQDERMKATLDSIIKSSYRDNLNNNVHNPDVARMTPEILESLATGGMCSFIQAAIDYIAEHRGS